MILAIYTSIHVLISLVGIFSGFVVVAGLLGGKRLDGWTVIFLASTIATSVTGFFFPVQHFMASHGVGIVSLFVLTVCYVARYRRHLAGPWRLVYVATAVLAFYLNFFVLVVQLFLKVPALKSLAPTQTEQPFKVTQLAVLVVFVLVGLASAIRFHPHPANA